MDFNSKNALFSKWLYFDQVSTYIWSTLFFTWLFGSRSLHVNVYDHESETEINKVENSQTARRAVHWETGDTLSP